MLGVQRSDLRTAVSRLIQNDRAYRREIQELRVELLRYWAQDWLKQARTVVVSGRPSKLVAVEVPLPEGMKPKQVAGAAIEAGADVAVVGCRGAAMAAVVMCKPDVPLDCGRVVRVVCDSLGFRGGGSPGFAQIGGFQGEQMLEVISALAEGTAAPPHRTSGFPPARE